MAQRVKRLSAEYYGEDNEENEEEWVCALSHCVADQVVDGNRQWMAQLLTKFNELLRSPSGACVCDVSVANELKCFLYWSCGRRHRQ